MRIFKFLSGSGADWIAATDQEQAESFYMAHIDAIDLFGIEVSELSDEQMDSMKVADLDDWTDEIPEGEENKWTIGGYRIISTFREAANGCTPPDIIATTEYYL